MRWNRLGRVVEQRERKLKQRNERTDQDRVFWWGFEPLISMKWTVGRKAGKESI